LTFMYSSTCFGRPHAHHQELKNCSSSLWFLPLERGDSSAVGRGRAEKLKIIYRKTGALSATL